MPGRSDFQCFAIGWHSAIIVMAQDRSVATINPMREYMSNRHFFSSEKMRKRKRQTDILMNIMFKTCNG